MKQLLLILFVVFTLEWADGQIVSGFRLYKIDDQGNGTQVGTDIAGDQRSIQVTERKGIYLYAVTAFTDVESNYSDPLAVKVTKHGARELH